MLFLISFFLGKKNQGPTEIRTRITGFRVLGANHYTMGPTGFLMQQDPASLFTKSHSLFFLKTKLKTLVKSVAVVAEWLRRLTRNQLRSPCTGSNPVNCASFFHSFQFFLMRGSKNISTPGGTRTHNPWLRRPMPYPLGHMVVDERKKRASYSNSEICRTKRYNEFKYMSRSW